VAVSRTDSGRATVNVALPLSQYGASMLSTRWYPDRYSALGEGLQWGHVQMGGEMALNLLREFSPELKRLLPGR